MTTSKAHHRSLTISIRAPPPIPSHQSKTSQRATPSPPHHKPSKSTPNAAVVMSMGPFLTLPAAGPALQDSLPQHNRELTLRRYLLLQEEHETIRRHLDELSATMSSAANTNTTTSPALSPARTGHKRADSAVRRASMPPSHAPRPRIHSRGRRRGGAVDMTASMELGPAAVDPMTLAEVASEEARLFNINEGIKRSLTELLNCETVRCDQALRQWIMARLLEVEKELRVGRRRRSCPAE